MNRGLKAGASRIGLISLAMIASLAAAKAAAAEQAERPRVTELPCPEPKPKFDPARLDRTLKEPKYASEKPLYKFYAFGPEGKAAVALALDESQGTGKGYDTLYFDFNANRDITEPEEKIALLAAQKPKPSQRVKGAFHVQLSDWGKPALMKDRKLRIDDPKFDYAVSMEASSVWMDCVAKDGSWHTQLRMEDNCAAWSPQKESAQVYRFGGDEFTFANEHFAGKTFRVGDAIDMNLTAPFFAGCSPSVAFDGPGGNWISAGYENVGVRLESLASPSTEPVDITLRGY